MNYETSIILGADLWGWRITEPDCFKLLDLFYDAGFREIDTASNYPINNDFLYYRKAENILHEWINANDINDLKIIAKVGSINNSNPPKNNLTFSFLLMSLDYYMDKFDTNLDVFMIHGDDLSSNKEIEDTVRVLKIVREKLEVGLTGIRYPEIYHKISTDLKLNYTILINHTIFGSEYQLYHLFHHLNRFIANADKNEKSKNNMEKVNLLINLLKETINIKALEHLNLLYSFLDPAFSGFIIKPKNNMELKETIFFYNELKNIDLMKVHEKVNEIVNNI